MNEQILMRDFPMLLIDRERMREEFGHDEFDNMTYGEFQEAVRQRQDELLDFMLLLNGKGD